VTPLEERLLERIRAGGPMPFAAYMSLALYDPQHGYYARDSRTGWSGDFVTSAELDPAFGALWARALEQVWDAAGRPDPFEIIEVGPGEGGFATAVLGSLAGDLEETVTYRLVERMVPARQRQRDRFDSDPRVRWSESITELDKVDAGVLFANEILDNLPVHLVERRGGELLEVCVSASGAELGEVLLPLSNPELERFFERHGADVPDGHRAEVPLATESFCGRASRAIERGAIVFVDYGATASELVTRPGGTLVCYSQSGTDDAVLDRPGEKDITAHANWSAVTRSLREAGFEVARPRPQRDVLRALGLGALDDALAREHDAAIAEKRGADAVRSLSRRHALRALTEESGLGGLEVVVGWRGIEPPRFVGYEEGPAPSQKAGPSQKR